MTHTLFDGLPHINTNNDAHKNTFALTRRNKSRYTSYRLIANITQGPAWLPKARPDTS